MSRRDRISPEVALEARRRVLGAPDPRCSAWGCAESDPRALTGAYPDILCAEHRALANGRSWLERQHVAGRHNDPAIVSLPANWHAVLTHMQQTGWSRELLRNPEADPLVRMTACLRGSRETIEVILGGALAPLETEIGDLGDFLTDALGPGWPESFRAWQGRAR